MPLEQDKSGGFKFSVDQEINTGLYPEVFSRRIPLWETGRNIKFTEYGVEKVGGRRELVDTANGEPIRGLLQLIRQSDSDYYIYAGDLTKLYEYNVETNTIATRGSGYNLAEDTGSSLWDGGVSLWDGSVSLWDDGVVKASQWSFVNYGDFVLATNGTDFPQIQKPSVSLNFVNLTGTDLGVNGTIEIFAKRGPHVLGFNTNISPREFIWCDADNVDDWIAGADNLAGQLEIRELKTGIKAAVPLGDRIAVYGEDQMFLVNYLGNDLVFGYQPALDGIGAVSKHAVVPVGRQNFGLSQQGFFVTDGASFEYIDDPAMRHWWSNNANKNQIAKTVAYHEEAKTQVRWFFPNTETTNSLAVTFNYKHGTWSFIEGALSAASERQIGPTAIGGQENGKLVAESSGQNFFSDPIVAWVRSKPLDLGNADVVKELDSIRIGFRGNGLQYRVGWSETENGTINWGDYVPMEEGFNFHNLRTAGRWLYVELYSNALNTQWEVMSTEVIGRMEGTR